MDKKNLAAFAVGLALLAYIIYSLEPGRIISSLAKTHPGYFLAAAAFYFLNDVVASISLKIITPGKISLLDTLASHMCGMFYSNATPGRVGYYYTSLSIAKKTKTKKRENVGLLTLFQGINFFLKIFLCVLALTYFSGYILDLEAQQYLLLVSVLPLAGVLFLALAFYTNYINKALGRVKSLGRFESYLSGMQDAVREVDKKKIAKLIGLAFLGWGFMSAQWYLLGLSLGLDLSYLTALMLQPLLTTVMFVPVSPSGLGVAEGGSALLFNAIGLGLSEGVAFMFLVRLNSILVDALGIIDMKLHKD